MKNLNKMKIAPDMQYEIGQDKVGYFPEWSVKDDVTLYEKVNKLAHSTFNLSKFTVVGSPNITNDGIASGFSGSNYLTINPTINLSNFKIKGRVNINNDVYNQANNRPNIVFCFKNTNSQYRNRLVFYPDAKKLSFAYYLQDGSDEHNTLKVNLSSTGIYDYEFSYNGSVYTFIVKDSLGNTIGNVALNSTSLLDVADTEILIGEGNVEPALVFWRGSIDLKQFSITVDGVEVFSGNKTGIDTIKPDDYTVVGSPTISADGVFKTTTTNGTNFVTLTGFSASNDLTLEFEFYLDGGTLNTFLIADTENNQVFCNEYGMSGFGSTNLGDYNYLQSGHSYKVKFDYNANKTAILSVKKDTDSSWLTSIGTTWTNLPTEFSIGYRDSNAGVAVIDLNKIRIYSQGNLVYQPCLKIPYTEGQNYVKVVDKLYRDRVKDLFEQKGYNGYYTIGEDDFTLPSNKWSDVIEHKENGLTVAEQRVDQTLTIRGACEQGVDVNLPMEFFSADSYAVFGVGTTGTNTASKFTPAADGNYIAIGKGKV